MGLTNNLGRISAGLTADASLNIGVGVTPSGTYKFEVGTTSGFTGLSTFSDNLKIEGDGVGAKAIMFKNNIGSSYFQNSTGYTAIYAGSTTALSFIFNIGTSNYKNYVIEASGLTTNTLRTYTLPDATGTLALTSNLSSYLPLTGGTLTGDLSIAYTTANLRLFLNNTTASTGRNWYLNSYSNGNLYVGNATAGDIFNFSSTGAATFSSSVTANILNSTASGSSQLFLKSTGGGSNRDWQFQTNETAAGDLSIMQSTTAGGATYATKVNISSGGNVGIGVTPSAKLEVAASGAAAEIRINSNNTADNNPSLSFYSAYSSGSERNWGFRSSVYAVGDFALFQSASAGASPFGGSAKLLIGASGAVTFSSSVAAGGEFTSTMGNNTRIFYSGTATTGYQYMSFKNTSGQLLIGVEGSTTGQLQTNDGAYSTVITTATATDLSLGTNQTDRLHITSGGNVGIGNSSPTTILNVGLTSNATTKTANTTFGSNGLVFLSGLGSTSNSEVGIFGGNDYSSLSAGIGMARANSADWETQLRFYTHIPSTSGSPADISEKMRITGNGDVGIGDAGSSATRLTVKGSGATSATNVIALYNSSSTTLFYIRNDKAVFAQGVYDFTSSGGTAVYVATDGNIYRFTSSLRYKRDVIDYTNGLTELLKIQPKFYKSKNPKEGEKVFAGLIAEQIDEIGLTEFVEYNKEGQPDAVHYSAMTALLVKAIQEQQEQIKELQSQINK